MIIIGLGRGKFGIPKSIQNISKCPGTFRTPCIEHFHVEKTPPVTMSHYNYTTILSSLCVENVVVKTLMCRLSLGLLRLDAERGYAPDQYDGGPRLHELSQQRQLSYRYNIFISTILQSLITLTRLSDFSNQQGRGFRPYNLFRH